MIILVCNQERGNIMKKETIKELKKMTNEQLVEVYKYYKPKAKRKKFCH